ncbi:hypothetical protein HPG69_017425, partial [Diceros bicornis minor]
RKLEQVEQGRMGVVDLLKEPTVSLSLQNPCSSDITAQKEALCSHAQRDQFVSCTWSFECYPGVISALSTMMCAYCGEILELEITTEPPTMGRMTGQTGQKYTVISAKTKIQKLSRTMQDLALNVDFFITHE